MAYETLNFLQNVAAVPDPGGSVVQAALARAAIEERAEADAAKRAADAKRAAAEERNETMAVINHRLGDPLGHLTSARAALTEASDEVANLRAQLAKAEARQAVAEDNTRHWADQLIIAEECTTRSVQIDPVRQAQLRAADTLRAAHEAEFDSRVTLRRARESVRRRHANG